MSIELDCVSKRFGTYLAVRNVSLRIATGELVALLGPSGSGKTTLLRIIAGLEAPDPGSGPIRFHDARRGPHERGPAAGGLRLPALRPVPPHDRVGERGLRPAGAAAPAAARQGRNPRGGPDAAEARTVGRPGRPLSGASFPAASGSAWPWPGRWPSSRRCCLLDEPFGALDAKVRQGLRRWLRKLHDEIAHHQRLRDPRSGRGPRGGRPHRGDAPRDGSSRTARPTRSSSIRPTPS